jgi:type I restriction enzyme, S subunit
MNGLPDGWVMVALADLGAAGEQAVLTGPFGSNMGREDFIHSGIPVFTIGCLGADGIVRSKLLHVSPATAKQLQTYRLKEGDFLFSRMASVGRAGIVPSDLSGALFNYHLIRLRLDENVILPRLFFYYVRGSQVVREYLEAVSRGATRDGINTKLLLNMPVTVPPVPEQRRIVAKIDSLSSKSKRARDQLDHIRRLVEKYKQAILTAAFRGELTREWRRSHRLVCAPPLDAKTIDERLADVGRLPDRWRWTAVANIADITGGLTKNAKRSSLSLQVPYLRVANVYANELRLNDIAEIGCTEPEFRRTRLHKGDLLIVEGNGSIDQIGRVAIWDGEITECSHQNHLIRARAGKEVLPAFVLHWLMSADGRSLIEKVVSSSSGLHTLSISKIEGLPIPICGKEEQQEIIRLIDSAFSWIDRLANEAASARKLIDHLDQAILAMAFRGDLVPQDPNDEPASVLLEQIKVSRQGTSARGRGRG